MLDLKHFRNQIIKATMLGEKIEFTPTETDILISLIDQVSLENIDLKESLSYYKKRYKELIEQLKKKEA